MSGLEMLGQVTVSLIVVLAVLFAFGFALKKINSLQSAGKSPAKVLSSTSVGPKERVVVIQMEDKVLILGVAPGRVSLLDKTDIIKSIAPLIEEEASARPDAGAVFRSVLKRYIPFS